MAFGAKKQFQTCCISSIGYYKSKKSSCATQNILWKKMVWSEHLPKFISYNWMRIYDSPSNPIVDVYLRILLALFEQPANMHGLFCQAWLCGLYLKLFIQKGLSEFWKFLFCCLKMKFGWCSYPNICYRKQTVWCTIT